MSLTTGETITVEGEGGSVQDLDVPPEGTARREVLESLIASGALKVLGTDDPVEAEPEWPAEVPKGTIDEIVAWVRQAPEDSFASDGWPERAQAALDAELEKGEDARVSLVSLLSDVLER